jgi:hypothetical protein
LLELFCRHGDPRPRGPKALPGGSGEEGGLTRKYMEKKIQKYFSTFFLK